MRAYSNDFRTKIVETNWFELESIQQTADRFGVSYSFVWKLLNRYGETGLVNPLVPWRRSQTETQHFKNCLW